MKYISIILLQCEMCSNRYLQKLNLIKHLASVHKLGSDRQPLTTTLYCTQCSFTTLAHHKLKNHMVSYMEDSEEEWVNSHYVQSYAMQSLKCLNSFWG